MYGKIFGYILSHLHHIFLHIQQSLFYSFIHRSLVLASKMASGGFNEGGGIKNYPGELTRYVMITCIVAAMGGLIFGYDIGISGNCLSSNFLIFLIFRLVFHSLYFYFCICGLGGVTSMAPFLQRFFPSVYQKEALDTSTNQYCKFDSLALTMFTSSLYLAALLASFVASWVTKAFGRKKSMLLGGFIFLVGAAINATAQNITMLIIGRIFLGIGVGFALQSIPLYVSEMAPSRYRGSLNVVFQLSITIGILVANFVNYGTANIDGGWGWRVSLGGAAVPALFITISALFLPNTPTSMLERGEFEKAKVMLQRIRGLSEKDVEEEFQDIVAASMAAKAVKQPWKNLRDKQNRPSFVMSILIPFFQQLTGINVVMFYAPVLFKTIGFGDNASLLSAVITGGINVVATLVSVYGTDKWGRRILFLLGGTIMFIFQVIHFNFSLYFY